MKKLTNGIVCLFFLATGTGCNWAAGSYPYVETYELDAAEEKVKTAIAKFKQEHSEYIVPKVTIDGQITSDLVDEQTENPAHWYLVYFYYPQENQIIHAWTRPAGNGRTTFAFVGVNNGLTLGNWRRINKDFNRSENKAQKKKFEERIVNEIRDRLLSH